MHCVVMGILLALLLLAPRTLAHGRPHSEHHIASEDRGEGWYLAHVEDGGIEKSITALVGDGEGISTSGVARLMSLIKEQSCGDHGHSHPLAKLTPESLVNKYGDAGVLEGSNLAQASLAILGCQVDHTCTLWGGDPADVEAHSGPKATLLIKCLAALGLFIEGAVGIYLPLALRTSSRYQWYLSLMNCFSGAVFLTAGVVHLLPHCAEAQEKLEGLDAHSPLYLLLVVLGYCLVLFVERVLFTVHAHGHGHAHGLPGEHCCLSEASSSDIMDNDNHDTHLHPHDHDPHHSNHHADGNSEVAPLIEGDGHGVAGGKERRTHARLRRGGGNSDREDESKRSSSRAQLAHQHESVGPAFQFAHGATMMIAMSVHTLLECLALGILDSRREFLVLLGAIASHKLVSGLALSSRFMKEGANLRQITLYVGPFAFVAPVSIFLGMLVSHVNPLVHLILSCFTTGTFLYVGASEVIIEEFEGDVRCGRMDIGYTAARYIKFAAVLVGVGAMAATSLIPEGHSH